jgi:hypothetical protein
MLPDGRRCRLLQSPEPSDSRMTGHYRSPSTIANGQCQPLRALSSSCSGDCNDSIACRGEFSAGAGVPYPRAPMEGHLLNPLRNFNYEEEEQNEKDQEGK